MATFTKTFTLKDIFNNKKLQGKLPLINYKEKEVKHLSSLQNEISQLKRLLLDNP